MAEKTVPAATEKRPAARREETRERELHLSPPVDIFETDEGLSVVVDLPGVEKDAVELRVDDDVLTIKATTKHIAPGDPVWAEYRLLNFFRQFELPEEVDQDKISAEMKHGVLTIHLPKKEQAKPRQIPVNVG